MKANDISYTFNYSIKLIVYFKLKHNFIPKS